MWRAAGAQVLQLIVINQLRAEVWGRGLGLDNFSPFASAPQANTKPQKLSFPLAPAVCYATA
jgi:hypothetical protein